jgi:SAM-dependent methyltransferase
MPHAPPDWQLPAGVSRGVWDYLRDPAVARGYDAALADCPLLTVDRLFAERHFGPPGRLLDLGCGTGRLLLPMARRGHWVLGVDLSEEMLRVAGAKARSAGVAVHLLKANLVDLAGLRDETFDYAACLFNTLGMVADADHRRRALAHVYRVLRPGGRFVLHAHNRWFNFWDPQGRRWLLGDVLRAALDRAHVGDRRMPAYPGSPGLTLHLFTRREVVRLLRQKGFRVLEVVPVSLRQDGQLPWPRLLGWLRAYGYLIAAERPG